MRIRIIWLTVGFAIGIAVGLVAAFLIIQAAIGVEPDFYIPAGQVIL